MNKSDTLTIRLEPHLARRLADEKFRTDVPTSALLRRLLLAHLNSAPVQKALGRVAVECEL
jgi:hypothetical protein